MADNKLKEIYIKNYTYYYLYNMININDCYFENILLDKKSCEDPFIDCLGYKIPYSIKPVYFPFLEVNGYIKGYDRSKYVALIPSKERDVCRKDMNKFLIKLNILSKLKMIIQKIRVTNDEKLELIPMTICL